MGIYKPIAKRNLAENKWFKGGIQKYETYEKYEN